jgi:hypothetical protein
VPGFEVSIDDVSKCAHHLATVAKLEPLDWKERLPGVPDLSQCGQQSLLAIVDALKGLTATSTPWRAFATIYLDSSNLIRGFFDQATAGAPLPAIALWQFQNFLRSVRAAGDGYPVTILLDHIRRLVILSDERDLRDLPAAAQSLDAVRLMTIHGSKGLEFKTLHLPSLTGRSMPSAVRQNTPTPPDGMIEGTIHSGKDAVRAGHDEEQECLFFVALSRAENELLMYAPSKQSDGKSQKRSKFIDRIANKLVFPDPIAIAGSTTTNEKTVGVSFDMPLPITPSQLALYEKCSRRFLYAHVLKLGGRRTESAFMKMHSAIQYAIDEIVDPAKQVATEAELDMLYQRHWEARGPIKHGYVDDYERIGRLLLSYLFNLRRNETPEPVTDLVLNLAGVQIVVRPDERTVSSDGRLILRRIRTGRKTSSSTDTLDAAAYQLAAGSVGDIEFVFLTDEERSSVDMGTTKLNNRKKRIEVAAASIRSGAFPANPKQSARTCPRCPYFFICTEAPSGDLSKKNLN